MRDSSEQPLVDGLRCGDRAAFDAAYARYRPRLHGFLLRLAGRRDVAEDLLQETFMKLARAAPTLREDTDLLAWLFTVARNAHVSYRRWAALDLSRLVALGEHPDPPADASEAPDQRADAARAIARLERAIGALSPASREVLLLVGVEGMEQDRAAEILGLKYDALRQRLARARSQLAAALERIDSPTTSRRSPEPT
jgi:RNA polymerase sigma-70 factor (ECF subfamily)